MRTVSMACEVELFVGPAGHSQGRELKAKSGSNFLPRLAGEEAKEDKFNATTFCIFLWIMLLLFLVCCFTRLIG